MAPVSRSAFGGCCLPWPTLGQQARLAGWQHTLHTCFTAGEVGCPTILLSAAEEYTICEYGTFDAATKINKW